MDVGTGELESPGPLDASGHLFVGEMEGVQLQMRAGGRVPGRELLFSQGVPLQPIGRECQPFRG
jgi:hypothetical protein